MEFIIFGLIILFLVGISSDRTTRTPTQTFHTSSTNSTANIEKNQSQPVKSDLTEAVGHGPTPRRAAQSPTALRSGQLDVPDDRCNKCGKKWHQFENSETGQKFYGCSGWPNCRNSREMQLLEKFCGNGHRRTESNNTHTASGARRCLICQPYAKDNLEDFCGNGHRRTESNFTYTASGARRCLICQPFPESSFQSRQQDLDKHCRNGHLRTPESTYVRPNGDRECRICRSNRRK
jgi:ssDNA-binding Zn-finger/Zn-ribbon topoisomerase 1